MSSLAAFTKAVIEKTIAEQYPHLKLPGVLHASVTSVRELTEGWREYTLTVLDTTGAPDEDYPILPCIASRQQFASGAVVAIALAYGSLSLPVIMTEVLL